MTNWWVHPFLLSFFHSFSSSCFRFLCPPSCLHPSLSLFSLYFLSSLPTSFLPPSLLPSSSFFLLSLLPPSLLTVFFSSFLSSLFSSCQILPSVLPSFFLSPFLHPVFCLLAPYWLEDQCSKWLRASLDLPICCLLASVFRICWLCFRLHAEKEGSSVPPTSGPHVSHQKATCAPPGSTTGRWCQQPDGSRCITSLRTCGGKG